MVSSYRRYRSGSVSSSLSNHSSNSRASSMHRERSTSSHAGRAKPCNFRGRSRSGTRVKLSKTRCWFGRNCTRSSCRFSHPGGRIIDIRNVDTHSKVPLTRNSKGSRRHDGHTDSSSQSPSPQAKMDSSLSESSSREVASAELQVETHANHAKKTRLSPPELSFRVFVKRNIGHDTSPEEARVQYLAFEKKVLQETAEKLKASGLLYDQYNPGALLKQHDARVNLACRLAKDFVADVIQQRYAALSLVAKDSCSAVVNDGECKIIGHLEAPYFAFDPNVNALCLSDVPPSLSVWEVIMHLVSQPGFVSASMPQLVGNRWSRKFRARFENCDQARVALNSVSSKKFKDDISITTQSLSVAQVFEASILPPSMSLPESITRDICLSAQVVRKLDALLGIPDEVTNFLLNQEGLSEVKLDLQVLYLRRVHCFCFYGCRWCHDEWELRDTCGPAVLRSGAPDSAALADERFVAAGQKWVEMHRSRIEKFVAIASFEKPPLPSVDEEPLRGLLEETLAGKILEVRSDKFRCDLCKKCFCSSHFARKHLLKVHTHVLAEARSDVCEKIAVSSYIADPMRPCWPPCEDDTCV